MKIHAISLAAPAYNEAAGIGEITRGWADYLQKDSELVDFEIVICNDGSLDRTGAVLDELGSACRRIRPVHHPVNQGAAAALTTAIQHTTSPWVLLIDSDGQYGIDNVDRLMRAVEEAGAKAAIGVRASKHDGWFARFGSWLSGALCNMFHGTHYRDFNCALKLVDGPLLRSLTLEAKGLNYSGEVTSKLIERGVQLVEVEVEHHPRTSGRSSATLKAAFHRVLFVFYLGFRQFLFRRQVLQRQSSCS